MFQAHRPGVLLTQTLTMVVTMLALAGTVSAQNLVLNGAFDFDAGSWDPQDSDIEIVFRGDTGSTLAAGSDAGSLEVRHSFWNGVAGGAFQNVTGIIPGTAYAVAGSFFIPPTDNPASGADILVVWYDGDGYQLNSDWISVYPMEFDTWVRVSDTVTAPGGAVTAQIRLTVTNPADDNETRPGIVLWDDVWMAEEGTDEAVQKLFVPAAASVGGVGGTFWSTTGWFSNTIDFPLTLWGAFLPPDTNNTARLSSLTQLATIPARGFITIEDIVGTLGESDVAGGLYLEARASAVGLPAVIATGTTHTFTPNPSGDGVYGQGLPAVGPGELNRVFIPGVFKNSGFRTNIGLLNTSGESLEVQIVVYDDGGDEVASTFWTLPPYAHKQASLNALGVGNMSGGTVVITRRSSGGSFRAYTSTVDQKSGDAVYNPGQ
ncbi:MAG: hypothetical protein ABFS37_12385 [Acidobacteriota bacterium]